MTFQEFESLRDAVGFEAASKEVAPKLIELWISAKLCRSYFYEDPTKAYEILADALRELES